MKNVDPTTIVEATPIKIALLVCSLPGLNTIRVLGRKRNLDRVTKEGRLRHNYLVHPLPIRNSLITKATKNP